MAIPPLATARFRQMADPRGVARCSCLISRLMPRVARSRRAFARAAGHRRFLCPLPVIGPGHGDKYGLAAASSRGDYLKLLDECNAIPRERLARSRCQRPALPRATDRIDLAVH